MKQAAQFNLASADAQGDSVIDVVVRCTLRRDWRGAALLRRVALHVAHAEGFRGGELSIAVVGARAMATLHQRHSGIAGATDVLTFDLGVNRRERRLDGEIVVCADVAAAVVAEQGSRGAGEQVKSAAGRAARHSPTARGAYIDAVNRELALYVAHGILHLAGYDDHSPRDFRRMHAREDALLTQIGLGAAFSAGV